METNPVPTGIPKRPEPGIGIPQRELWNAHEVPRISCDLDLAVIQAKTPFLILNSRQPKQVYFRAMVFPSCSSVTKIAYRLGGSGNRFLLKNGCGR